MSNYKIDKSNKDQILNVLNKYKDKLIKFGLLRIEDNDDLGYRYYKHTERTLCDFIDYIETSTESCINLDMFWLLSSMDRILVLCPLAEKENISEIKQNLSNILMLTDDKTKNIERVINNVKL